MVHNKKRLVKDTFWLKVGNHQLAVFNSRVLNLVGKTAQLIGHSHGDLEGFHDIMTLIKFKARDYNVNLCHDWIKTNNLDTNR